MIFAIIELIALLIAGGFSYHFISKIVLNLFDSYLAEYPTYYSTNVVVFVKSIFSWFLFFMLLGGAFRLWIWVQRKRPEGYYA